MNFDQTYILVYCDLEFIIDTLYFNNMSVQTGGGTYLFLRKHCSSLNLEALSKICSRRHSFFYYHFFSEKIRLDISRELLA